MAIIGRNDISGMSAVSQGSTTGARLNLGSTVRTAVAGETAVLASFYLSTGNPGQLMNIYLYDTTGQTVTDPDGAPLVATTAITTTGVAGWHTSAMSFPLVAGNDYAVALGQPSVGLSVQRDVSLSNGDGGTGNSTTAPDPWDGNASTIQYAAYISTTIAAGPTLTSPNSTTEGSATVAGGTLLDTVTTFSLISGTHSIAQTIDSSTATTLNYVAESGVNQCTPGAPVSGVPLEPTITAAGITPYVVQQEADDGVNPKATRNITLNGEATHEVIQTMIASANVTEGESIFAPSIVGVEDDHQAYVPKVVDGVTFTWSFRGDFTTDKDQTVTFTVPMRSKSTGNWSCISLTVRDTSIIAVGMITDMVSPMITNMIEDM